LLSILAGWGAAGDEPAPAAETIRCFAGQGRAVLPKDGEPGQAAGGLTLLLKRTCRPVQNEIAEEAVIAEAGRAAQVLSSVSMVSGEDYLLREKNKRYQGHGRLIGAAWHWTGWTLDAALPDSRKLTGTFVQFDDGLAAARQLFNPDGSLAMLFFETYRAVAPDEYERRKAEMLAPAPAPDDRSGLGKALSELKIADWKEALGDPKDHTIIGDLKIIDGFPIPQLHRLRRIWIWLPPGYGGSGQRYPVLYMQDGQNVFDRKTSYAGEWQVDESLAALAGAGKGPAAIVVAVDNGRELRMREYVAAALSGRADDEGEKYAEFLARTLKPYIDAHFRTLPDRDHTGVAGSSAGAAISFYAGVKYPEVFSRVGAFSFVISKDFIGNIFLLNKLFPRNPALPMRFYLHVGTEEGIGGPGSKELFVKNLRWLAGELVTMGYHKSEVFLDVEPGGVHNEGDWAKRFPPAFEWLFQGN
jgi:predicted alpha/beta superfamily hydrolase